MKIKKLALKSTMGLAVGAGLAAGLASCGAGSNVVDIYKFDATKSNGILDIYLNYAGSEGITLRKSSFENTVEGVNYVKGDLLPTWRFFQAKLNYEIKDATTYGTSKDADTLTALQNSNYTSETDNSRKIDIFYNTTSGINDEGKAGKVVDLAANLDKMPNFKKFLDANPTIKSAISVGGHIYYTPYFDGYNAIERMFIMDVNIVKKVLDEDTDATAKDTAKVTENTKSIKAFKYQPFIDATNNYPTASTTVAVSKNAVAKNITIKQTTNIIKQQNEAAATATGQSMRKQLRDYLKTAFEGQVGAGKTFENLSDIFVSESAAYNVDELIALMRVVKASPELITGDAGKEVQILVPRAPSNNRIDNMADFMEVWGIQGFDAEKDMLYFDENGKIHDAASTKATYQGLEYLSQIYDEGLILTDFYKKSTLSQKTGYLDKYFGKTADNGGYGFMMYDYSASTGAVNTQESGVGTPDSSRVGTFANTSVTGVMPVLPPLTYWGNTKAYSQDQDLGVHTNKTLMRYSDSDRALKSTSWAIPESSDNKEGAFKMLDYLCSKEGALYNDFGPDYYWNGKIDELTYGGQTSPVMSEATKAMIASAKMDFWTFMRGYLGATHGIGYTRSASINYQATNKYAQIGTKNIESAIAAGAVTLALVDNPIYKDAANKAGFASAVPSAGYGSVGTANAAKYEAVTAFWGSDKYDDIATGWAKYITDPAGTYTIAGTAAADATAIFGDTKNKVKYTYKMVMDQIEDRVFEYLYTTVNTLGAQYVPDYAKTSN